MSDAVLIAIITSATTALATVATMILGLVPLLRRLEHNTNAKFDLLLEETRKAAEAAGRVKGRAEGLAER